MDLNAIQRVVMDGLSFPTGMIAAPTVLGSTPELDEPYGFDLDKARALMAEAGYPDGFSVQLDCPNNRYVNDEKICQAAVGLLARIGVDVKLDAVPKNLHFTKIGDRNTDFFLLGWGVPTLDSQYVMEFLLDKNGRTNAAGYDDPHVNELIAAIATELGCRQACRHDARGLADGARRRDLYPAAPPGNRLGDGRRAEPAHLCQQRPDDPLRRRVGRLIRSRAWG